MTDILYLQSDNLLELGLERGLKNSATGAYINNATVTATVVGIPGELYTLFGAGYLGYVVNRSKDKELLLSKSPKPGLLSRVLG